MQAQDKKLKFLATAMLVQWVALAGVAAYSMTPKNSFETIDVQRLTLVDSKGGKRMVIANDAFAPAPVMQGKELPKEARSVVPTGIILFDHEGNEAGGFAMAANKNNDKMNVLAFDYQNSEAIGFNKFETTKGDFSAHFVILDRLDLDKDPLKHGAAGETRLRMGTQNKNASFELSDTQGKPRIRLSVDKNDVAKLEMLDAQGQVVWSAPQNSTAVTPN